jgi:photosystem II stability/assembly factor-like uncharacterized protein
VGTKTLGSSNGYATDFNGWAGRDGANDFGMKRFVRRGTLVGLFAALALAITFGSLPGQAAVGESIGGVIRPWDSFYGVARAGSAQWYVVAAEGVLLTSSDGGKTWQRRRLAERGPTSWFDLYSIGFASDGRTGWITGERGVILHTTDGGRTWESQHSGVKDSIYRVAVISPRKACAVGNNGVFLTTEDGGQHWNLYREKAGLAFFDVTFTDPNDGWAAGEFATIMHTADGGKSWQAQKGGTRADYKSPAYFAVQFGDSSHGWVAGQGGVMLETSDAGKTWQNLKPAPSAVYAATFVPSQGLWMAGNNGAIISVPAAEATPAPLRIQRPSFSALTAIAFDGSVGFSTGLNGTLLRTDNGGKSWEPVALK